MIYIVKNGISTINTDERVAFFYKPQACLRASSLGKRYGWEIHHDSEGKIAIYPVKLKYQELKEQLELEHTRAMRSTRDK